MPPRTAPARPPPPAPRRARARRRPRVRRRPFLAGEGEPVGSLRDVVRDRRERPVGVPRGGAGPCRARRREPGSAPVPPDDQFGQEGVHFGLERAQSVERLRLRVEPPVGHRAPVEHLAEHGAAGRLVLGHVVVEPLADPEGLRDVGAGVLQRLGERSGRLRPVLRLGEAELLLAGLDRVVGRGKSPDPPVVTSTSRSYLSYFLFLPLSIYVSAAPSAERTSG
jgi:hypothetical protein